MSYLDKEEVSDGIDRSRLLAITSSAWFQKGHLPFASMKEGALSAHKQQHHVVLLRQAQYFWRAVGTNLSPILGQRCNTVKIQDVMHLRMLVIDQPDSLPGHQVDQDQGEASKSRRNLPGGRLRAQH
jgi:hypothetical protein